MCIFFFFFSGVWLLSCSVCSFVACTFVTCCNKDQSINHDRGEQWKRFKTVKTLKCWKVNYYNCVDLGPSRPIYRNVLHGLFRFYLLIFMIFLDADVALYTWNNNYNIRLHWLQKWKVPKIAERKKAQRIKKRKNVLFPRVFGTLSNVRNNNDGNGILRVKRRRCNTVSV